MPLFIVALNCVWIVGMGLLSRNYVLIRKYGLSAQSALVSFSFAGLNFLIVLMMLFDMVESAPHGLLIRILDQKITMVSLIVCVVFFVINVVFGVSLAWRRLGDRNKAKEFDFFH